MRTGRQNLIAQGKGLPTAGGTKGGSSLLFFSVTSLPSTVPVKVKVLSAFAEQVPACSAYAQGPPASSGASSPGGGWGWAALTLADGAVGALPRVDAEGAAEGACEGALDVAEGAVGASTGLAAP